LLKTFNLVLSTGTFPEAWSPEVDSVGNVESPEVDGVGNVESEEADGVRHVESQKVNYNPATSPITDDEADFEPDYEDEITSELKDTVDMATQCHLQPQTRDIGTQADGREKELDRRAVLETWRTIFLDFVEISTACKQRIGSSVR
jgi:hypothetical protein